jgi:preprotein translocase subunit SecY
MPEERSPIFSSIQNIFSIQDLRKRILYMLLLLAVYRVGAFIPTPGINHEALAQLFDRSAGTIFGFLNMFSGGAFRRFSIFALGIMPYITASIILQLAAVVVPYLEKLSKEGELGRKKITQYTRYLTGALSLFQGFMTAVTLERIGGSSQIVLEPGWGFRFMVMITLMTGTVFIMWLGEQITERGIGNGISLIIFAGIVVNLPSGIHEIWQRMMISRDWSIFKVGILVIVMIAVVAAVVFVERGQRKIPVQYAKRVVGRRVFGGQATHLPLRVNSGGVIPVIFAASIVAIPATLAAAMPYAFLKSLAEQLRQGWPLYNLLYVAGIIFFCFFYVSIIFNPMEVADNIRKFGGYIPGIRPGHRTAEYIDTILSRLTAAGAIYLVLVCLLPEFLMTGFKVQPIPLIGPKLDDFLTSINLSWLTTGLGVSFYFGGTSLLIVVGVAMDTIQQIESQLIMRHYDGFLKKGRVRGRRS